MTNEDKIKTAIGILSTAIKDDDSYARGWHANLAMAFYDSINEKCIDNDIKHCWCNEGATRFMKLLFNVDFPHE